MRPLLVHLSATTFAIGSKVALLGLSLLITGCSLWPFGKDAPAPEAGMPVNASRYECDQSKKFYVRMIDNGTAAWVILADREVSLAKLGSPAETYSNGISTLTLTGNTTTLLENAGSAYTGCHLVTAPKP